MGRLHDTLKEIGIGYTGHSLELYRVRLLFVCLPKTPAFLSTGCFKT